MKPYGNRVLVEIEKTGEKQTDAGIILPESADNSNVEKGTVIAVGDGRHNPNNGTVTPIDIKEGAVVLYAKYSGTSFKAESKEYKIVNADDIIGIED